jgi:hypothetical protein
VFRLSKWADQCEATLTAIGLPYDFERFICDTAQLPDTFIVYSLVDDPGVTHADNKETSHEARQQVSLFYRDKSIFLTVPDQIETAFMAAGFMRVGSGTIPYQPDTGHYGWRCDFRYFERR